MPQVNTASICEHMPQEVGKAVSDKSCFFDTGPNHVVAACGFVGFSVAEVPPSLCTTATLPHTAATRCLSEVSVLHTRVQGCSSRAGGRNGWQHARAPAAAADRLLGALRGDSALPSTAAAVLVQAHLRALGCDTPDWAAVCAGTAAPPPPHRVGKASHDPWPFKGWQRLAARACDARASETHLADLTPVSSAAAVAGRALRRPSLECPSHPRQDLHTQCAVPAAPPAASPSPCAAQMPLSW